VQRGDPTYVAQHFLPDVEAGGQRRGHRQVKQYTRQHAVLVIEADVACATDQVGAVFAVGQPARRLGSRAAFRQGKHRSTKGSLGRCSIGVDRDKQVGAFLAGDFGAATQRDKVVAGTRQLGPEAFHAVDLALQFFGNRQHHVFFTLASRARGPRVFTAVAGIDHHHHAAFTARDRRQFNVGLRGRHRHHRHRCHVGGRQAWRQIGALVIQVDHQAVAVLGIGRQNETFRGHGLFQVDNHAQVGGGTLRRAHAGDWRIGCLHIQRPAQGRAIDVDDQTIRCSQRKHTVLHRPGKIKNQSSVVRRPP